MPSSARTDSPSAGPNFSMSASKARTATRFSGSLSARVARRIDAGAWRLTPHVQAEWQHRFDDDPASITASFTAIESEPFTVAGLVPVEDQAVFGAGLQAQYNHTLTIYSPWRFVCRCVRSPFHWRRSDLEVLNKNPFHILQPQKKAAKDNSPWSLCCCMAMQCSIR